MYKRFPSNDVWFSRKLRRKFELTDLDVLSATIFWDSADPEFAVVHRRSHAQIFVLPGFNLK
jgi:hypothetical protein